MTRGATDDKSLPRRAKKHVRVRFRHDPRRLVLAVREEGVSTFDWRTEPAIVGHSSLTHTRKNGEQISVPICATPAIVADVGAVVASFDGFVRLHDPLLQKTYWGACLGSAIYAPVAVDPERPGFLVCCVDGTVARFGLKGELEWSTPLGDHPIYAAPLVMASGRTLVVATFRNRCFGLSLDTGSMRFDLALPKPWHTSIGGLNAWRDPYASPVAVTDSSFAVCCAECMLRVAIDGTVLWTIWTGCAVRASPVLVERTGEIFVVGVDGSCRFLNVESGHRRDGPNLGAKVVASPAISGGIVAIGTTTGAVSGLDAGSGTIAWTVWGFAPRDHSSFHVLPSGDFVVTSERGNAVALQASDGRFLWETDQRLGLSGHDPSMDITPVASHDGYMYCASYSGHVYSFRFRGANGKQQTA